LANAESKRLYLALFVWVVIFLVGLALVRAGVLDASVEYMAVSFVLGLVAVFVFFRPVGG
jgi:hypothetical protein